MFCDLVESTRLSGQLDPETLRDVVRSYQGLCSDVIGRFRGHIAQYLGDGILAYFGYPAAHEDDAQRAVRAALAIRSALVGLNAQLKRKDGVELAVRLGIHTGLVVVGQMGGSGRQETLALGETPNVAARLQALAEPDTVVISEATHRLVRGVFESKDLGLHVIKGMSEPVRAYRIFAESEAGQRVEPSSAAITPLVGRDEEVGLLLNRWERVSDGLGQVVFLSGEPGIGKSRLVRALKDRIQGTRHTRWECRCSAYTQDSALHPMLDLFERALQFGRDESPREKLAKIETALARLGLAEPATTSLWAVFLSIPLPEGHRPLNLTPQRQKQKIFEAILALLLALAAEQPVLFVIEDLHWIDPSTLELLDFVVDQVATAPVLILLTGRRDFRPPWDARAHVTHLTVNRVTRRHTELMVERVAGGKSLPGEVLREVVTKTDGVPLFVEELTKMVLEAGLLRAAGDRYELTGPLPPLAIPATLRDSLMARLDRLSTVKDVAQLGAALGRSFSYELLQAVTRMDEPALTHALARLVDAELLYQQGVPPNVTYIFKHALIQDTAYESMLKSRRQSLHERIAQTLAERFPELAETQPELLAHHCTEAGLVVPAVEHWLRAGQRAAERSANVEAIAHLTRGLEVVRTLPDARERAERELEVQTALGPALMATKGYAAPEVEQAYARALALCQQVGETMKLGPVLYALWGFYLTRADLQAAEDLTAQLLRVAHHRDDPALLIATHRALGTHRHFLGDFARAREHTAQGIALWSPERHRTLAAQYAEDAGVVCRCFGAHHLWFLGYPDQALAMMREALALAHQLGHPFSVVHALDFAAWLHLYRREERLAHELVEADIGFATEQQIAFFLSHGTIFRGWALVEQGQAEAGLALIREGIAAYRETGAILELPFWLALQAEASGRAGHPAEGLPVIAAALAEVEQRGWRFCEAELHRTQGELLLHHDARNTQEAEACFRRAIDIASRQEAKSLELRAAISLSRVLQQRGEREEGRRLLTGVYAWFTEGFDTLDLQDARALLDALAIGTR
jgi:class 3 adenylate cyclase/predicted ATPase